MKFIKPVVMTLFILPMLALGLAGDEIEGRVLDVDENEKTITVRVNEAGDDIAVSPGAVKTFSIDSSTQIEDDLSITKIDRLDDIQEQDEVRLKLDPVQTTVTIFILG